MIYLTKLPFFRILNSTGVMVETLRMFEAIKEAEMAYSSSGSESDEPKSPVVLDKSNISTDDEAPREEKIQKRTLSDDEEPSGSHKKYQSRLFQFD
jgi:hypothetical protein